VAPVKVAAVQAAPVLLDREATTGKVIALVDTSARPAVVATAGINAPLGRPS
jgi:predicted amidohydrolase